MKHRVIHLLSDEDISYILTGLKFLGNEYIEQDSLDDMHFVDILYDKIDNCSDIGVISNERV